MQSVAMQMKKNDQAAVMSMTAPSLYCRKPSWMGRARSWRLVFWRLVRNGHRVFKSCWKFKFARYFVSTRITQLSDWSISLVVIYALSFVKFTQELR